ncbi:MAG: hypothetical protein A3H63_00155 [Candidatus Harrisonbacteria bacterium RIFCSPLOWO2_02_FULL_45_10c]|uniref:Uncharacterized protein n=1 Tax=Candidatus Harrisonbacteria bacterium RIFCSPLOWO2_02_FULL_45_10c TaxID=1798410 RepID=A0A1G1ZTX0_9BACT|nr:MAG: hypothetical protein A3H63_00155 [Candidatus Harrisonbacteria bacterium RIFCSPLOWO2_02_FULL_45_10c]
MDNFKKAGEHYFETLKKRSKESRIYKPYQSTGLLLAELLEDPSHKSLYMKLAKTYDNSELIQLARTVSDRKNIDNKGAYFMKILKSQD